MDDIKPSIPETRRSLKGNHRGDGSLLQNRISDFRVVYQSHQSHMENYVNHVTVIVKLQQCYFLLGKITAVLFPVGPGLSQMSHIFGRSPRSCFVCVRPSTPNCMLSLMPPIH